MDIKNILARNFIQLMKIRGINKSQISSIALAKGYKLHKNTLSDLEKAQSDAQLKTIEALADVLHIEPCYLFWDAGFNPDGTPVGSNQELSLDIISWVIKKVDLNFAALKIDDLKFKTETCSRMIKIASEKGTEEAEVEFSRLLMNYNK